jgi:hypothetical protein
VYGDFSRVLDGPSGRYSAVLAQQGRFLLDAELNEQTMIVLDYLRRLTTDLIGPFAGPLHHSGFDVEPIAENGVYRAVELSHGHYYVYGLRCEAPAPDRSSEEQFPIGEHEPPLIVYLMVWEQSIGAVQDPGLVEPALGPGVVDTTRRSQVRWRPHATKELPGHEDLTELDRHEIAEAFHEHNSDRSRCPRLAARASAGSALEPGPEAAPVASGYSGVENQLYRVEVHDGGDADEATFKWSRDNGSVELALEALSELDGQGMRKATLRSRWRDAHRGLQAGDWVELVDDRWSPVGAPPPLMRVEGVSLAKREVTLADTHPHGAFDLAEHPFLRRWDQRPGGAEPGRGIPIKDADAKWRDLEDGVQVQFTPEARYQRGDYWLIPARAAAGGVLWPSSIGHSPFAVPPHGPVRYLAPLALVTSQPGKPVDLRTRFAHLVEGPPEPDTVVRPAFKPDISAQPEPEPISAPPAGYRLRSLSIESADVVFELYDGMTVGRSADCGIAFDSADISRRHALFAVGPDGVTIMDLGSTNGTSVNGQRLTARAHTPLSPGDTILIGTEAVQLQLEEV